MNEQPNMQKGHVKVSKNERIFETRDTTTGKRKVRVDERTIVYTSCKTDQEAINKFNKLHNQNIMKTLVAFLTVAALFFTACSKDEAVTPGFEPGKVNVKLVEGMSVSVNGEYLSIGNSVNVEPGQVVIDNIDSHKAKIIINFRGKVMSSVVAERSTSKLIIDKGHGIF